MLVNIYTNCLFMDSSRINSELRKLVNSASIYLQYIGTGRYCHMDMGLGVTFLPSSLQQVLSEEGFAIFLLPIASSIFFSYSDLVESIVRRKKSKISNTNKPLHNVNCISTLGTVLTHNRSVLYSIFIKQCAYFLIGFAAQRGHGVRLSYLKRLPLVKCTQTMILQSLNRDRRNQQFRCLLPKYEILGAFVSLDGQGHFPLSFPIPYE